MPVGDAQETVREIARIVSTGAGATAEILGPGQEAVGLYEKYKFLWGGLTGAAIATALIFAGGWIRFGGRRP